LCGPRLLAVLPPKTRLYLSLALGALGLVGLYAGDWLVPETQEEKKLKGETASGKSGVGVVKAV
jgi:hypothetical protein